MSIPLFIELHSEVRRLLVAGSELAVGDFRLKKLQPQIKKAGESVPVFARVADALEKTIEPGSEKGAEKLLELANIVNAILYTQGQTGIEGELCDVKSTGLALSTTIPYRKLKPAIEALTTKGSGRLEIIRAAFRDGILKDLRLINPLISALEDNYSEISDLAFHALEEYGIQIVPVLKDSVDLTGGKGEGRKVNLISKLAGKAEKGFYMEALEKGSLEVKVSAITALKDLPECEAVLIELSHDKKKDIREASLMSLAHLGTEAAAKRIFEVFNGKDRSIAAIPVKICRSKDTTRLLLDEAEKALEVLLASEKGFSLLGKKAVPPTDEQIQSYATILDCMEGKKEAEVLAFLKKCLEHSKHLHQFKVNRAYGERYENTLARMAANNVIIFETPEAFELLETFHGKFDNCLLSYSFEAAIRVKNSAYVFDHYSRYLKANRKSFEFQEILRVMEEYIDFNEKYRLTELYSSRPENQLPMGANKDNVQWDARWLKLLTDLDELELVCRLVRKSDSKYADYLLGKLETHKLFNDVRLKDIIRGLLQIEYPDISNVIIKVLDFNFKKTGYFLGYYFNDFARVLQFLPAECAKDLESFAVNYNNEAAATLLEVAQSIKNKK